MYRGCERSVITYSSLISACEKAGQWELALELFQEMLREQCTPNTVTFNSLITALAQGAQTAPRRLHGPSRGAARQRLQCQLACGQALKPRPSWHGLTAYHPDPRPLPFALQGRSGRRPPRSLNRCRRRGATPTWSPIPPSSQRWRRAASGAWRSRCGGRNGARPALLRARHTGGVAAQQARADWPAHQCVRDPRAAVPTQPPPAPPRPLQAYERMKAQGCRADAIVYNAIIDALWETGVVWVQRRALRLFRCAPTRRGRARAAWPPVTGRRQEVLAAAPPASAAGSNLPKAAGRPAPCRVAVEEGHFHQGKLVPGLARAEVNLHAMTAGVAMLSLYAWLVSLKQLLVQHGTGERAAGARRPQCRGLLSGFAGPRSSGALAAAGSVRGAVLP